MKNTLLKNTLLLSIVIGVMAMSALKANAQKGYADAAIVRLYKGGAPHKIIPDQTYWGNSAYSWAGPIGRLFCANADLRYSGTSNTSQFSSPFFIPTAAGTYLISVKKEAVKSSGELRVLCGGEPKTQTYTVTVIVENFDKKNALGPNLCPPAQIDMKQFVTHYDQATFTMGDNQDNQTDIPNHSINVSSWAAGDYIIKAQKSYANGIKEISWDVKVGVQTSITGQPESVQKCVGATHTFRVVASGTNLSYQWKKGNNNVGSETEECEITDINGTAAGNYRVRVTGMCGMVHSEAATLTVHEPIAIEQQPTSAPTPVCKGTAFTAAVRVRGTSPTYQWLKNGGALVGETNSTLRIVSVTKDSNGDYRCRISGGSVCPSQLLLSDLATLTVHPDLVITSEPTSSAVCAGMSYSITVVATGGGALSYRWHKGNLAFTEQPSPTWNLNNFSAATAGIYKVKVKDRCMELESKAVQLSLVRNINIITQPESKRACLNTAYTVSVAVEGDAPTYEWLKNGRPISGATTSTYRIDNVTNDDAGSYVVVVRGHCNDQTSAPSVLEVISRRENSGEITFDFPVENERLTLCTDSRPAIISNLVSPKGGTFDNPSNAGGLERNGAQYIFTPSQNNYTANAPWRLTYHVAIDGCEAAKVLSIHVKDNKSAPVITNIPSSVCPNVPITLNGATLDADAPPYSYEFLDDAGSVLSTTDGSYHLTVGSLKEIRIRNTNAFKCRSKTEKYALTTSFSSGDITANKTDIKAGESIKFGFSGASSTTFNWSFGDGFKGDIQSPRHYYFKSGDYTVTLEVAVAGEECKKICTLPVRVTGDEDVTLITADRNGRNDKNSIYPNPVKDILYFKRNTIFEKKEIEVYSLEGRLYTLALRTNNSIDVSSLASGVYALKVGEKYVKFIKH